MAAYGLYSHIQSNRRRSIALLIGLFFLVFVLVYAGALLAAALSFDADLNTLMQIAWVDLLKAAPFATAGTALPNLAIAATSGRGSTDGSGVGTGLAEAIGSKVPAPGIGFSIGEDRLVMTVEQTVPLKEDPLVLVTFTAGEATQAARHDA